MRHHIPFVDLDITASLFGSPSPDWKERRRKFTLRTFLNFRFAKVLEYFFVVPSLIRSTTHNINTRVMEPTSTLFQAGPVIASDNDQAKKYVRWKDDEEKAICELLKSQWEVEKASNSDTLDGTKFWPLISEKLKESGIDKTSEQCRRYWHGIIRHQPEFKDTLQFQSRNSTPAPMSNTGTNNIHGAQHLGVESRLRNDTPASMSESRTDNIPGDIGTKDTPGAMSQVDSANGEGRYYWTEDETQKLKELVLANRSSNPKDQQKVSEEFWTLISKQLETYNIHRTWLACRRRFNRICGNQVFPTKQDIIPHSDDSLPNLYEPKADIVEDGDTGYMDQDQDQDDEPSPRRGDRKRMSRPPWTDEEHNRLVQLLKARRELEDKDESLEKLSNNKLFTLVSKQLKQYLIEKSAGACTLYWSSKGFLRSGFDINSPALYQSGRDFRTPSALPALSPVGKDIAEAFSRLPQQHFDDSSIVRGFRKVWHPIHCTILY
jgi:hypothetical protein